MKRTLLMLSLACLAGCGGGKKQNPINPQLSNIKQRAFVLNAYSRQVQIVDSLHDSVFQTPINVNSADVRTFTKIGNVTLITSPNTGLVQTVDDVNEIPGSPFSTGNGVTDVAVSSSSAYLATPAVGRITVENFTSGSQVNVTTQPSTNRVAISHNFNKVLTFADGDDTVVVVNPADLSTTTVSGFDRPYTAIFTSDDSEALVLNCGAECGGTASSVSVLDLASNTIVTTIPVAGGATAGYSDGSKLYVAGNSFTGSTYNGSFVTPITLSTLVPGTASPIGFGLHTRIMAASNGKLFIGAQNCVNPAGGSPSNSGCLSIYNPGSGSVTINAATNAAGAATGDVTGMANIPNRNVVYVAQGGELVIYDITTEAPLPQQNQIDFVGNVTDVEEVD